MDRPLHHRKSEYLFPTAFESASHSLPWGRAQNLPSSCAFRKTIERSPNHGKYFSHILSGVGASSSDWPEESGGNSGKLGVDSCHLE